MNKIIKPVEGSTSSVVFVKDLSIKIMKNTTLSQREVLITHYLISSGLLAPQTNIYFTTENITDLINKYSETGKDISFFKPFLYKLDFGSDPGPNRSILSYGQNLNLQNFIQKFSQGTFFILNKKLNGSVESLITNSNSNLSLIQGSNSNFKNIWIKILEKLNVFHSKYKLFHGDLKFENILYEMKSPDVIELYFTDFEWTWPLEDNSVETSFIRKNLKIKEYFPETGEDNEFFRPIVPKMTINQDSAFKYGNLYHGLNEYNPEKYKEKYPRIYALDILALIYVSILYNKFSFRPEDGNDRSEVFSDLKIVFNNYFIKFCIISGNERKHKGQNYDSVSEASLIKMIMDA